MSLLGMISFAFCSTCFVNMQKHDMKIVEDDLNEYMYSLLKI